MRNISWLELAGRATALAMAVAFFGGFAYLVDASALYAIMAVGIALIVWDFLTSARESAEKNEALGKANGGPGR
jgi:hypothetical protein